MDIPWIDLGYSLDSPWMFLGWPLDIPWITLGYSLDSPWIFLGYPLDVLIIIIIAVADQALPGCPPTALAQVRNSQPATRNTRPQLKTRNTQPATRNSQPATRNPQTGEQPYIHTTQQIEPPRASNTPKTPAAHHQHTISTPTEMQMSKRSHEV